MELTEIFQRLGVALGLGLLVGLQRERVASRLAGFRTFPLVTVFGALSAALAKEFGGWIVAAALAGLAAVVVVGNFLRIRSEHVDPGMTTETAVLVMFCVGAFVMIGPLAVAVVIGASVAVLLHLKPELHGFAQRIGERDFRAIMFFVVISLIILPVLPDKAYGPFQVLNPHRIWWLMVLITGISLGGYVVYKLFGKTAGAATGGILGGLISSTATTLSYARRSREAPASTGLATAVIMLAGTVVFGRVLLEVAVVSPDHFLHIMPRLAILMIVSVAMATLAWLRTRGEEANLPEQENPTEFKPALIFTALFALVLLATAAAKHYYGSGALYLVAVLSGLTDMDAITLSTAQMAQSGSVPPDEAARIIVTASMANIVFKAGTVLAFGGKELAKRIAALFGVVLAAGGVILAFW